jgi:hypothetical protein
MPGDGHETVREDGVPLNRLLIMSGKAQDGHGPHFGISSQSGDLITNVGGDQYIGERPRRSASIGRALAALGLAFFFAGLFMLAAAGLEVYRATDGLAETTSVVVPGYAIPAGMLVVAGIVLNRFGRLFAGR